MLVFARLLSTGALIRFEATLSAHHIESKAQKAVVPGNVDHRDPQCNPASMQRSPKQLQNGKRRAPRVSVPNNEQAKVEIGPQQLVGTLGKLSFSGGTIRLPKRFDPGTMADLTLKTNAGKVSAAIEFLAPLDGFPRSQAFRFVQMEVADSNRLEKGLSMLRNRGHGEKQNWGFSMLLHTAQRTLAALKSDD